MVDIPQDGGGMMLDCILIPSWLLAIVGFLGVIGFGILTGLSLTNNRPILFLVGVTSCTLSIIAMMYGANPYIDVLVGSVAWPCIQVVP